MYTIGNDRNSNGVTRKSTNVRVPTYIKARCKQSYCTVVVVLSTSTVNAFPPTQGVLIHTVSSGNTRQREK